MARKVEAKLNGEMNYKPDFLIIPYEVHACDGLRPSDSNVYAVVYWFEKMRGEKCTAGNTTIGDVARIKERAVRAALDRLDKFGFIERIYDDQGKRVEIRTLVSMARTEPKIVHTVKSQKIEREEMKPGGLVKVEEKIPTPGEIARDFFAPTGTATLYRGTILKEVAETIGAPEEAVVAEARKFYTYWTEPTKSGTKQRWETERTFEVKRRLYKWLSNTNKFSQKGTGKTGSGATI